MVKKADEKLAPDLSQGVGLANRHLTGLLLAGVAARGFGDLTAAFSALLPHIQPSGSRQIDVARRAGLTKQAVGQLVRELQLRGYVELDADPDDARAKLIRFTERGLALREAGLSVKREIWSAARRSLGKRNARKLADALSALSELSLSAARAEEDDAERPL